MHRKLSIPQKTFRIFLKFLDLLGYPIFWALFRKKPVPSYKKILVFEFWSIGDIVMMTSIIGALKTRFPDSSIDILCKPSGSEILKQDPRINKILIYDFPWTAFKNKYNLLKWDWKGMWSCIKKAKSESYDLILDARGDIRNNIVSFLIRARKRVGYDWTGGGFFLTDVVRFDYKNKHRIDAWAALLTYLGVDTGILRPQIFISQKAQSWAVDFLESKGVKKGELLIGIHPGARIKTRCWPLDRFAEVGEYLINKQKAKLFIFIEPEGYGENISLKGEYFKIKVPMQELIALIKKMDLLICNDSGAMHMATAVGTPVVAIFGPQNPVWFGPYGNDHSVVIKKDMECRPCFDYCKFKEPLCTDAVTVSEVLAAAGKKLETLKQISPDRCWKGGSD